MNPPSTATKAYASALIAVCAAIGGTFADSTIGKIAIILGAAVTAWLGTYKSKNTQVVKTGDADSVTLGEVVSTTGEVVGDVVATTGAATGGIVKGTTGTLGKVLDATIGLLPGTKAAA